MSRLFFMMPVFLLCALLSCRGEPTPSDRSAQPSLSEKVVRGFERLIDKPDLTVREVEKLQQREYLVRGLPIDASAARIEDTLNELGKDRWDCSAVEKPSSSGEKPAALLLLCKRIPETLLRYVPQSILGR